MEQSFHSTGELSRGVFVSNLSIFAFLRYTLSKLMTLKTKHSSHKCS